MQMKKIDDKKTEMNDPSGEAAIQMIAKLQKEAEQRIDDNDYNSAVNSPKTIYENRKVDNENYWKIDGLPSKGILYPSNTLIEARPLKVIEVKKLASINDNNVDDVINDIIKRCVRVSGIKDIGEIYLADKLFIIFWLRGTTYRDSSYTVDFKCPKCEKNSRFHFELQNLEINYLRDDYNPDKILKMENDDNIKLRFLKIKDEIAIERFVKINEKLLGEIDTELLALAFMITEINNNNLTLTEKYNYVLDMSPRDLSYITTYIDAYGIGIEPNMNVECQECGGVAPMGVTFRPDFFLPKCSIA